MRKAIIHIILLTAFASASFAQEKIPVDYYKALNYYSHENYDSALIQLNSCTDDPNCAIFTAKILFDTGNYSSAIEKFKSIIEISPKEASFGLATIYAEMGFADESIVWLEKYFECKNPKSYSEIITIKSFDNISNSSEWREFWNESRYSKKDEKLSESKYLIKSGNPLAAVDLLQSEDFGSLNYLKFQILSEAYFATENYSAASSNIDISLAKKDDNSESLNLKYEICKKTQNYQDCYTTAIKLLEVNAYDPQNLFRLSESCLLVNRNQEALTFVNTYLGCFPDSEIAVFLKVNILNKQQDYRNALISLNKLISLNSSEKDYFILRADIYYLLESWKFASDDYSMALDITPFQPEVYYKMGVCQFNLNNKEKACHSWKKAANMKNRDAAEMLFKYCTE